MKKEDHSQLPPFNNELKNLVNIFPYYKAE
jgi:hypothetical protein